jgi:hypothetical protein
MIEDLEGEEAVRLASTEIRETLEGAPGFGRSWNKAEELLSNFRPLTWSIWRTVSYILGNRNKINSLLEGMCLGYYPFLDKLTKDPKFLVKAPDRNSKERSILNIKSDIAAATLVVHSTVRRLNSQPYKRLWNTILYDALTRAELGFYIGQFYPHFSAGRAMIAGFASRAGLTILLATGDENQAVRSVQAISEGRPLNKIGLEIYGIEPMHLSAHLLLQSGTGTDSALGMLAYNSDYFIATDENQKNWEAAYSLIEAARLGIYNRVKKEQWELFNLNEKNRRSDIEKIALQLNQTGHTFSWLS